MRVGLVGAVLLSACSFEHGSLTPDARAVDATDSGTTPDMATPLGAWSTPVDIGISSGRGDDDPSLTDDMTELYFGSRRIPGSSGIGDENIWVVTRASATAAWGDPAPVDALNTSSAETTMKVSGDGLMMFFTSDRTGNAEIYVSKRNSRIDAWESPIRVDELNSPGGDYAAFVQRSKTHVVLCSGGSTAGEALYTSERSSTQDSWGTPVRIAELDEAGISECDPMEPRDESTVMYYSTWRLSTNATYDIYRVDRPSAANPWGNRTKVEGINTDGHHDRDPWVSADERTMYFSSTRDGSGVDKIYMSTR